MAESSQRFAATLTDRYRIERELGAGGMATVFLAEDVRHRRKVALKVLHPELSAVLGPERFLKEIELTASLQHPHILPLFDSGSAEGQLFYVMPFVEGETLRARLEREQQLPIPDAVRIAREVADALQYAHDRGVVHRDIKPENILLQGGHALVADFGIALAVQQAGGQRMTQTGLSLGTPQYMAPEQAMGEKAVDARADVYALGAVTYEMLAGEPPFNGPTAQAIVARLLTTPPAPITQTRTTVPAHVEHAILGALAKLPADRPASAKAFSDALANPAFDVGAPTRAMPQAQPAAHGVSPRLFIGVAAIAAASLATAVWAWQRTPVAAPTPASRFTIDLPDSQLFVPTFGTRPLSLAPDGSELAFVGISGARRLVFRRRLDALTVTEAAGTLNAANVLYASSGTLAFEAADRALMTVPLEGRPSARIVDDVGRTAWGDNDVIVFIRGSSLWRTNSRGTPVTRLTSVDSAAGEGDTWPFVLPGGKAVLFNHYREAMAPGGNLDVFVVRIADGVVKRLDIKGSSPRYVSSGHLLVTQSDGTLLAAPFDLRSLELRGPPVRVLEGIYVRTTGGALYDVSRNGVLVYVEGGASDHPVLVSADGREHDLGFAAGRYVHPRFSPNGERVVVERSEATGTDIWILTRATGQIVRLTRDGRSSSPEWSADGQRVGWIHADTVGASIRWQRADGGGTPEVIRIPGLAPFRFVFTPDGKSVVAVVGGPFRHDIVVLPIDGNAKPRALANTAGDELQPAISPDGKWLAYSSSETGRAEVFVVSVSDPTTRLQVTTDGGNEPVWKGDGYTIVARTGGSFVAFTLRMASGIELTQRATLFADIYPRASPDRGVDASAKTGDLVTIARVGSKRERIVVVTRWLDELRERMASSQR